MNKTIIFDVDDILLDFLHHSLKHAESIKNQSISPVEKEWCLKNRYGLTENQLHQFWDTIDYSNLPEKAGSSFLLKKAIDKNYNIHFVTAINNKFYENRKNNLKNVFMDLINFDKQSLHCVGLNGSKKDVISDINPDIMIDDRLSNLIEAFDLIKERGIYLDTGVRESNYCKDLEFAKENISGFTLINNISQAISFL